MLYGPCGLVVRMFKLRVKGLGFNPWLSHGEDGLEQGTCLPRGIDTDVNL